MALPNICSLDERIARLHEAGADDVVVPFTRETASLTYVELCALLTEHLDMRSLYVGEDFTLGRRRAGTRARLRELGVDVWTNPVVPSAEGTSKASSSNVRNAIARGVDADVALAAA
jgi:riboflavin kinase/FMN adenylyltransferase